MASELDVKEVESHLSYLLARVRAGEEITIAQEGKPVAKLVPLRRLGREAVSGMYRGRIAMADDFNAPLPEEELREWEK
jgi:prevent-host-death family protein